MQGQSQNKKEPGCSPRAPSPPLGFPPGQEQRLGSTLTLVSPGTPSGAEMEFSRSASFPTACLWWALSAPLWWDPLKTSSAVRTLMVGRPGRQPWGLQAVSEGS